MMSDERKKATDAIARQLRIEMAIAQVKATELTEINNVSAQTIRGYLSGKTELPVPVLLAICKKLEINPSDFLKNAKAYLDEENSDE